MKNVKFALSLLLCLSTLVFVRCTPGEVISASTKEIIMQNKWTVNYYFDGQDQTAQFHGYQVSFNTNDALTCTNGTDTFGGSWHMIRDVNNNDVITMTVDAPSTYLESLNTDWTIGSVTMNTIGMKNSVSTQLVLQKL